MAKISKDIVANWTVRCAEWLQENSKLQPSLYDIKTGRDAWTVAHCTGIAREAYDMDRDIHDAHIKTALQSIFPNAVFKDKYSY